MQLLILSALFLLLTLKINFLWLIYFTFIPGFCILKKLKYSSEKCLIYAIPFTLLIFHWPYFMLSRIGLTIPYAYFYIIPMILAILYLKENTNEIKNLITNTKITIPTKGRKLSTLILTLLLFATFYYVFSPFASEDAKYGVPLTLGARYIHETEIITQGIREQGQIPKWSDKWFGGMHMLYSYPPLSYLLLSSHGLNSEIWKMQNRDIFAFTFIFALFFYIYLTRLKIDKTISLTIAFLSACLPGLIRVNDVLKSTLDFTFLIIFLYSLTELLQKPDKKNTLVFSVSLFAWTMNYYFIAYIMILPLTIYILIHTIIHKNTYDTLKHLTLGITLAILLSSIWSVPFIGNLNNFAFKYQEAGFNKPHESIGSFLNQIAYPTDPNNIEYNSEVFMTLSPQYFYAGIICGLITLLYGLRRKNKNYIYPILSFLLLLFLLIQFTYLRDIIPKYEIIYGRVYQYYPFVILFGINIALLINTIKKNIPVLSMIALLIFTAAMIPVIMFSHNMADTFLTEKGITSKGNFNDLHNAIDHYGKGGRFMVFGIFGPGIIPAITKYTDVPAFAGYGFEAHTTHQAYEKRIVPISEASMDFLIEKNPAYAYNIFKNSGVKVLIYNICNRGGKNAYETLKNDSRLKTVIETQCIILQTIPDSTLAGKIELTEILTENPNDSESDKVIYGASSTNLDLMLTQRDKAIRDIKRTTNGEHIYFTSHEFEYPQKTYKNIIIKRKTSPEEIKTYLNNNQTILCFKNDINISHPNFHTYYKYPDSLDELNNILKIITTPEAPVKYKHEKNEWDFASNGITLIKETYFPNWKSNHDIKQSYLGLMLVKSNGDTYLKIGNTHLDIIGFILSLLGYMLIGSVILKKINSTDNNEKKETQKIKPRKKRKRKR
ncbi:MAG: hypothetical protein U9Q92_00855 [archaeon]|nr:hypothetical protein [archaeon]